MAVGGRGRGEGEPGSVCLHAAMRLAQHTTNDPPLLVPLGCAVNEINNSLEQLSTLNGSKPEVVQMKRECFQVWARRGGRVWRAG